MKGITPLPSCAFSLVFLINTFGGTLARAENSQHEVWRTPKNGGINVLYCYLRVNGIPCNYDDLLNEETKEAGVERYSVTGLARVAKRAGIALVPISLTLDELVSLPLPRIVHIERAAREGGAFALLVSAVGDNIFYLNGPSATIQEIDRAAFRRIWTGIALVPEPDSVANNWILWVVIAFCMGIVIPFGIQRYCTCRSV